MNELHDIALARLRAINQRYTDGRRELVDRLSAAAAPVTIPELLALGDASMAQSSAYRNLAVLEQAGVVHRITASGDFARFELAEDLTEHHHHLICSRCGAVEDFTAPVALERTLGRAVEEIASAHGFDARQHRLDLIGVCERCA